MTQRPNEDIVTYRNRSSNYEKIIESFYNYLIDKGYKINAAKSVTHGIRQLFRYYHMDVMMRHGSNVTGAEKPRKARFVRFSGFKDFFAVKMSQSFLFAILEFRTEIGKFQILPKSRGIHSSKEVQADA